MPEAWECPRCKNIYAPNVPFCLYCWFQQKDTSQTSELIIKDQSKTSQNTTEIEKQTTQTKISTTADKPIDEAITHNKNLYIPHVDIEIPQLNKTANYPIPDKFPDTKIFLAGIGHSKERAIQRKFKIPYILDSIIDFPIQPSKLVRNYFDYIKKTTNNYLLDSGAFSYMNNPKKSLDLNTHIKQYCYYINEFDINDFFELDLDVFMSIDEVENIRRKIYLETHKQPIIVYHGERGHDYWINMCKENDYIAIGGLVTSNEQNSTERFKKLSALCDEAHSYNTKVHGLGFTPLTLLNAHTIFFDTVDSTSWNTTRHGSSTIINEKGELVKIPAKELFSASDGQEEDLFAWATFAEKYKGGLRA